MDTSKLNVKYITDKAGKKSGVILPIHEFEELLQDLEDLSTIAERVHEETISHDEVRNRLKEDGLLQN